MEENQQELIFKLSMFEQQIQQLQQQLQAIEQAVVEMSSLKIGLDEFKSSEKEIFAPVGRGIFIKAQSISEELIVDVGGKNFVTKSIPETKDIIDKQINKLEEIREDLNHNLDEVGGELQKTLMEAQGKK